jgi:excisionase family DNA binding protein
MQQLTPLITLADAAKLLGVSLRQVRRYIDGGKIPVCRISERTVRIRLEDLASFVDGVTTQVRQPVHNQ